MAEINLASKGLKRKKPQTVQKQIKKATPAQLKDFEEAISSVIEQSQDPDPDDALYSDIDSSDGNILYDSQTVVGDCVDGDGAGCKHTDDQLDHQYASCYRPRDRAYATEVEAELLLKFLEIAESVDDIDVDEKLHLIPKTTKKTLMMYISLLLISSVRMSLSTL